MKLTADTITDEQIRRLGIAAVASRDTRTADLAARALGYSAMGYATQKRGKLTRARCAEILNAKAGK